MCDGFCNRAGGCSRYSESNNRTWNILNRALFPLHDLNANRAYVLYSPVVLGDGRQSVPTQSELSLRLNEAVGWTVKRAAGLVEPGEFLETIAGRVFPATDFVRDCSRPLFSPDPDWLHEAIGHIGSLAVPKVADFYAAFGREAARVAHDPERLGQVNALYWYSAEVGLIREAGQVKVFGGAILSSVFEMVTYANADLRPFDPKAVAASSVDVARPQPVLYVADSLDQLVGSTIDYLRALS